MVRMNKIPFLVTNEVAENKTILTLSGVIRKRYWSNDDSIDAKLVKDQLDNVENDIVIRLNSTGGDVFQGVEIYNYLKNHPQKITVEITGTAASAATFIALGADEVMMNIGTTFMIHKGSTFVFGNKKELEKAVEMMSTIDESIINIYVHHTNQTAQQIESWMDEEKWFTADEAVEYGFANSVKKSSGIEDSHDVAEFIRNEVAVAMANLQETSLAAQTNEEPKNKSLVARLRKGE